MKLRFVTSNQGKVKEAQARLASLGIEVVGNARDLEEIQADTIEAVARHKARQLLGKIRPPFFIEDAGLHIDALRGFPATYSSFVFRTIGVDGILRLLEGKTGKERRAYFLAVIAYVDVSRRVRIFTGRADGHIADAAHGKNGFGFDPIFIPDRSTRTFAELDADEKGEVSHRGHALDQLARHLSGRKRPVVGKKP
ncbi:MAG TPA: XTP/dITP diphosphatase [Candidatus Thermoplasmatota archaeon]